MYVYINVWIHNTFCCLFSLLAAMTSSSLPSFHSRFWSSALRKKPLSPASDTTVSGEGLVRRLGLFDLILIGIGASIGAGIFVVTGTVARDAGPGVTISFIIAGASCVLNGLCYAELASRFPAVVGGAYLYTYSAFNELTAFLVFTQLMLDYHIGAASIARSLASYVITVVELIPNVKGTIPIWIGHGQEVLGALSINILAPVILLLLTLVLCRGVGESSILNAIMTMTKILIVLFVIVVGAFKVDVSNWTPFAPHGFKSILTGATVVFFAYVGFDAVANSAEEAKKPQRDLPLGIMGSLFVCVALYVAVCLVITGMIPYGNLGEEAPLAQAFTSKGLKYVSVLISFGAVAGLTTTLLVGLYVQSRLYLGLGRDGLLPALFAKVHPTRHTPIHSQVWVGLIASILAGLLNVRVLSHILSVGSLTKTSSQLSTRWMSNRAEGIIYLLAIACCGFAAGVLFRYDASYYFLIVPSLLAIVSAAALCLRQVYIAPPGFSCPGVPIVPSISIFVNIFLFAQLHYEAWMRFIALSTVTLAIYAFYGQFHANPVSSNVSIIYRSTPVEEAQAHSLLLLTKFNFIMAKAHRQKTDRVLGSWNGNITRLSVIRMALL
ncbi:cationic amino acid transporter 9 chloroplastic [Phtheirospermum japonicum]|uniref:Cationic amino acid transporter 9 chloroplastic n=1 Tax=Phtheirospermum japonicum TaxID=374723 RepID=A0A830D1Q2_9LAMI|nr:cationic amino acid transporter 9 chloroplastic [Phtheirospermum japonicum]